MKTYLFIHFYFITHLVLAHEGDSLIHAYQHAENQYQKAATSYEIGRFQFFQQRKTESKRYFNIALDHALQTDSLKLQGDCNYWLGYLHYQASDYSAAIGYLLEGLARYKQVGNADFAARTEWLLGKNLLYSNQLHSAEKYYAKAKQYFLLNTSHRDYQAFFLGYADVQRALGRNSEALALFTVALEGYKKQGNPSDIARVELDLGITNRALDHHTSASIHFEQALQIGSEEAIPYLKVLAYYQLGKTQEAQQRLADAEQYYREGVKEATGYNLARFEFYPLAGLIGVLADQGRYSEAIPFMNRLQEIPEKGIRALEYETAHAKMIDIYTALGEYEMALIISEAMLTERVTPKALRDSVISAEVAAFYKNYQLAQENEGLTATLTTKDEKLQRFDFLLSLAVLAILALALLCHKLYKKLKAAQQATAKAIVHVTQAEEKVLAAETQAEEDRKRMESLFSLNRKAQENIIKIGRVGEPEE